MSNPFRPDTDSVRLAYVDRQGLLAQFARTGRKEDAAYEAEFDLWLAKVKADAWAEGYRAGSQDMSDLRAGRLTFQTITSNPYRQEATR